MGSFLFLACLHSLLSLDLNFMFSMSSLSTHSAANSVTFFLLPSLILFFLFMVEFKDIFSLSIHFLKEIFFPIMNLNELAHRFSLSSSLLIQVIVLLIFFFQFVLLLFVLCVCVCVCV